VRQYRHGAAGNGFTLIELLVVLAVMGFVLVLVTAYKPMWSNGLSLEATASELASGLRLARAEAIAGNRPVAFEMDLPGHRYSIGKGAPRALPPALAIEMLTIRGERLSPDVAAIRFNPDGSSTGGRITIAEAKRRVAVGVDWLTGRITTADVR
jgi:general secretion pathway protein H